MVQRRHYITALFLLILPVVVIYALTNYGIEEAALHQNDNTAISAKPTYACQQKKLNKKEGQSQPLEATKKGILKR